MCIFFIIIFYYYWYFKDRNEYLGIKIKIYIIYDDIGVYRYGKNNEGDI